MNKENKILKDSGSIKALLRNIQKKKLNKKFSFGNIFVKKQGLKNNNSINNKKRKNSLKNNKIIKTKYFFIQKKNKNKFSVSPKNSHFKNEGFKLFKSFDKKYKNKIIKDNKIFYKQKKNLSDKKLFLSSSEKDFDFHFTFSKNNSQKLLKNLPQKKEIDFKKNKNSFLLFNTRLQKTFDLDSLKPNQNNFIQNKEKQNFRSNFLPFKFSKSRLNLQNNILNLNQNNLSINEEIKNNIFGFNLQSQNSFSYRGEVYVKGVCLNCHHYTSPSMFNNSKKDFSLTQNKCESFF